MRIMIKMFLLFIFSLSVYSCYVDDTSPEPTPEPRQWYNPTDNVSAQNYVWNEYKNGRYATLYLDNYIGDSISNVPGLHPGVNITGNSGDKIYAITDGSVIYSNFFGEWGNCIIIEHEKIQDYNSDKETTLYSIYAHLKERQVYSGYVKGGTIIGTMGNTGYIIGDPGIHLHFQIDNDMSANRLFWPISSSGIAYGRGSFEKAENKEQQENVLKYTWNPMYTIAHQAAYQGSIHPGFNDPYFNVITFSTSLPISPEPTPPSEFQNIIEWQKCLGGSGRDQAASIKQTTDGGYVIAGRTFSNDADVSGSHGKTASPSIPVRTAKRLRLQCRRLALEMRIATGQWTSWMRFWSPSIM